MRFVIILTAVILTSCASAPSVSSGNGAIQRKAVSHGPSSTGGNFRAYIIYVKNSDGELVYEDNFVRRNNIFSRSIDVKAGEYEIAYTCVNKTYDRPDFPTKAFKAHIPAGKILRMNIYEYSSLEYDENSMFLGFIGIPLTRTVKGYFPKLHCSVQFSMSS